MIIILIYYKGKNKCKGEVIEMRTTEIKKTELNLEDQDSLRGTLFSTLVFVGGGIIIFIIILFIFYMIRV